MTNDKKKSWKNYKIPYLEYDDVLLLLYCQESFKDFQPTPLEKRDFIERTISYLIKNYFLTPEELIYYKKAKHNKMLNEKEEAEGFFL